MADDDIVPDADAAEQDAPVVTGPSDREDVGVIGERPEADVLEQSVAVSTEQATRRPAIRDDVPEADAWEQAIEEPLDDERE